LWRKLPSRAAVIGLGRRGEKNLVGKKTTRMQCALRRLTTGRSRSVSFARQQHDTGTTAA
jgi:hypothetical protein